MIAKSSERRAHTRILLISLRKNSGLSKRLDQRLLANGLLLASNAPRAVSRFSPKVPDVSQAFGGLGNWISWKSNPSELKKDEIQLETKQLGEESFKSLMAQFAKRLEKLEAADGRKIQDIRDINRAIDDLQKQNLTIWESYNAKLLNIEENMGKNSATSVNEMTSIKLEFQGLREMYGSLKECCDKNAVLGGGEEIEKQVDRVFAGYFGTGVSKHEIKKIIENLMIVENDKNSLMGKVQASTAENSDNTCTGSASLTDEDMRRIVNEILKIYDADKTGRVDYALESAGGQVMSTRCTQRYNVNTRAVKLLGFTLFYESNNPRTVIQGNKLQPGVCWAFTDFPGYILIKLRGPIKVTGFTVEHAPRSILPNKEMKSAPRKFNIWGLTDENDGEPVMFGEYEFQDSDESLQYFPIQNLDITRPYEYVEMRIHSNHGQLEYTCVYRIRVHGVPA